MTLHNPVKRLPNKRQEVCFIFLESNTGVGNKSLLTVGAGASLI